MQEYVCRPFSYENETPFLYFCTYTHILIYPTKAPLILLLKRMFHVCSHRSSPCATAANQLVMAKVNLKGVCCFLIDFYIIYLAYHSQERKDAKNT